MSDRVFMCECVYVHLCRGLMLWSSFKGPEGLLGDGMEPEGVSRWVSRESKFKWQRHSRS